MDLHNWYLIEKGGIVCVAGVNNAAVVVTSAIREAPVRTDAGITVKTLRSTYTLRGKGVYESAAYERLVAATQ